MIRPVSRPATGLSALEFLIYASLFAVLSAFTPYWIERIRAPAEIGQAVDTVEETVLRARRTARLYRTEVIMHVQQKGTEEQQIVLSIPAMQPDPQMLEVRESIPLPPGCRLVSETDMIRFDPLGNVEPAVRASVISDRSDRRKDLLIF